MYSVRRISFIGYLSIFAFFCSDLIADGTGINETSNLTIGCNFPTLEYYTCATEFPSIPDIFMDSISNENEDAIYFQYIGGSISNPSNPVIITATMVENSPKTCIDSFMVILDYLIDDGETQLLCRRTFITMRPPFSIVTEAQDTIISCDQNVDSLFNDWLVNYGYSEYLLCAGNIRSTTIPEIPEIEYSCEGNGIAHVEFILNDGCGNYDKTSAEFQVIDTVPPSLTCPQNFTFEISSESLYSDIDTLLNCYTATDACNANLTVLNSFDENQILYNCDEIQLIPIEIEVDDNCGNSASCIFYITLENKLGPSLSCPENITIECGDTDKENIINHWLDSSEAFDFYGEQASLVVNYDNSIFSSLSCDTIFLIEFAALDICSRTSSCSSNIVIRDTLSPKIDSCPFPLTLLGTDPDIENKLNDWLATFQASDNCNDFVKRNDFQISNLAFSCEELRTYEVLFEAEDDCGNINSCLSYIEIINDLHSEIVCPGPLKISCGDPMNLDLVTSWIAQSSAFDNLGVNYTVDHDFDINLVNTFNCYVDHDIVFSFENQCGDSYNCESIIVLQDTLIPIISCPPDNTLNLDLQNLIEEITLWTNQVIASDNCRAPVVTNDFDQDDLNNCLDIFTLPVIFYASDSCALKTQCTSYLTIETEKAPRITCPPNLLVSCGDSDNLSLIEPWLLSGYGSDYLDSTLFVENDFDLSLLLGGSCLDSLVVTFSATDFCLNTVLCSSKIYIEDKLNPVIFCPDTLFLNSTQSDYTQDLQSWLDSATGTDICSVTSFSNDMEALTSLCNADEITPVLFTIADKCLLSESCSSYIHISQEEPTIFCPINLILECGDQQNETNIESWLLGSIGRDNSGNNLVPTNNFDNSFLNISCQEIIPVEFSVTDMCNKDQSCIANIIITDNDPPDITCPPALNLFSGNPNLENSAFDWLAMISATDCNSISFANDLNPEELEFFCEEQKSIVVNFSVIDQCSNISTCQSIINIENNVETELICPQVLNVECGDINTIPIIENWLEQASAEDNLENNFQVQNNLEIISSQLVFCNGEIDVEFTTADICNQEISCSSSITIIDSTNPTILCPEHTELIIEDENLLENINNWIQTANANDNCLVDTINNNLEIINHLPTCEDSLLIEVLFEVQDLCSYSAECTSILKLISQNSPSIHCELPLYLECGDLNNEELIFIWLEGFGGTDYYGNNLNVSNNYNEDAFYNMSCNEVMDVFFEVTDDCNESTSCVSRIILNDSLSPELICPDDITVNSTDEDIIEILEEWADKYSAMDNCSATELSKQIFFNDLDICNQEQIIEIEFQVRDQCDNESACIGLIFVNNDPPSIQCPQNLSIECGNESNPDIINSWIAEAAAVDNTGNALSIIDDYNNNGILFCDQEYEITFSANDRCDQNSQCKAVLHIIDSKPPKIDCPENIQLNINSELLDEELQSWLNKVLATDQCGTTDIVNDFNTDISLIPCIETVDVEFKAIDACENLSSCQSEILFENIQDVSILCPENISLICGNDSLDEQLSSFINSYEVQSTLQYMVYISPEQSEWKLDCVESYTLDLQFEVEDECGNKAVCSTNIDFLPQAKVYIPNTFSPNGDGHNDSFTIFSNESVINIKLLSIYDRWGNLIFTKENFPTNAENEGWTLKGQKNDLVDGVYTYFTIIEDRFGNNFNYSGTITLFK